MMDSVDFRKVRNVLQPIFSGTIVTANATHEVLVLSDSGSTVGFTVKEFMMSIVRGQQAGRPLEGSSRNCKRDPLLRDKFL